MTCLNLPHPPRWAKLEQIRMREVLELYLKQINFGNRGNARLRRHNFDAFFVERRSSQVNRDQQLMQTETENTGRTQKTKESIPPLAAHAAFYTFNQVMCMSQDRRTLG